MSASAGDAKAVKPKRAIEVLRDRRGGLSKDLKEYFNTQQRVRKAVKAALRAGPQTVPQIATASGVEPPVVLWHLMAMRRYGEVTDGPEQDGYVLYRLKGA